jgi:vacuolar protein sorting-associated protein 26
VVGSIAIAPSNGKSFSHRGIQLQLIGEFQRPTGEVLSRFFTRLRELLPPGDITQRQESEFKFSRLQYPTSSFQGASINVVYTIELRVKFWMSDFVKTEPLIVVFFTPVPTNPTPIHNEVGVQNALHIEFVFSDNSADVAGVLVGTVYFLLIKLRVVHMEISLHRTENYFSQEIFFKKEVVLDTFEVMDGATVKGDHIPVRLFLPPCNVWPFDYFEGSKLKVDTYLRACLTDEHGKKYFKRLKVNLVRFPPCAE